MSFEFAVKGKYVVINDSSIGRGTEIWNFVNIYKSEIGKNCKIASHVEIGESIIGDDCKIEAFAFIPPGTRIGNNVFIGPGVLFANDKYPHADPIWEKGPIEVGDNVSIGIGVIILPNVTIGDHSFVAAGAMVTKSIPPYSFAMGRPAQCVSIEVFKKVGIL